MMKPMVMCPACRGWEWAESGYCRECGEEFDDDEIFGCVWRDDCGYETPYWDSFLDHARAHGVKEEEQ